MHLVKRSLDTYQIWRKFIISYFEHVAWIGFEDAHIANPLMFQHYDAKRPILGKSMARDLRQAFGGVVLASLHVARQ